MWFPNRSVTNLAVQAEKMARGWKLWILTVVELYCRVAKTKATAKLICVLVKNYSKMEKMFKIKVT